MYLSTYLSNTGCYPVAPARRPRINSPRVGGSGRQPLNNVQICTIIDNTTHIQCYNMLHTI